ncbi:MAG: hypothetical protein BWY96_01096 [Spirochaetes bacterium ADurb.BinA120]|nr:MAG: hypothetical protein BWY96_01096 [Spirochaetes bacterium ADurb.BinA120]
MRYVLPWRRVTELAATGEADGFTMDTSAGVNVSALISSLNVRST